VMPWVLPLEASLRCHPWRLNFNVGLLRVDVWNPCRGNLSAFCLHSDLKGKFLSKIPSWCVMIFVSETQVFRPIWLTLKIFKRDPIEWGRVEIFAHWCIQ
jgi:hypothetical protein